MQIVRVWNPERQCARLGRRVGDAVEELAMAGLEDAVLQARVEGSSVIALLTAARAATAWPYATLDIAPHPDRPHLLQPVVTSEVWGAGVTYLRSRQARMEESVVSDVYQRVYEAVRPELFFKATASRCVGPNQPVGIRGDTQWCVPEPELALLVDADLNIVGYTLGNDMSARDIEGENPLYLPQAKVYAACCSIGPAVYLCEGAPEPFPIVCRIRRGGEQVFQGETSTARMRRDFAELVAYLGRDNPLPPLTLLLTGTGIVPPDGFTLAADDVIEIESPAIGCLRNPARLLAGAATH